MQKIKIANRIHLIKAQAKLLKSHFVTMADIGTDHGYLPYLMHHDGLVDSSILCDINEGPLENAKKTFQNYSQYATDFRLGSGIEPIIPQEVELVVIAGMGGGLIQEILMRDLEKSRSFPYYIIQPMTEQNQLRRFLLENDFMIIWDYFFTDVNKHYELMLISTLKNNELIVEDNFIEVPSSDLEFGFRIKKDQLENYFNFLSNKKNKYLHILKQISNDQLNNHDKISNCQDKLHSISRIEQSLKTL